MAKVASSVTPYQGRSDKVQFDARQAVFSIARLTLRNRAAGTPQSDTPREPSDDIPRNELQRLRGRFVSGRRCLRSPTLAGGGCQRT
jgi:hypothetical protein